ncbi:MAG: two-component regulator propeller domain-containing protein, partial [bacterium]
MRFRLALNTPRFSFLALTAWVVWVLSVVHSAPSHAQPAPRGLDPRKSIGLYIHEVWGIDNGLPQSTVRAITQGKDGYLWLASEAGIVRFDGVTFTTLNSANTKALKDNSVTALLTDRADVLWAGTWVGGAARIVAGKGQFAPGSEGSLILGLHEDRSGVIWAARESGVSRWTNGRFQPFPGIVDRVNSITDLP